MTNLQRPMVHTAGAGKQSAPDKAKRLLAMVLVALVASANPAWASYCVYVGKNLTIDGSVFLGGYGDEPSSHWLEIVPARTHAPGTMIWVGGTEDARLPASMSQIPQAARTAKYITMNYSEYAGYPEPLTNGGLNEYGVAARDVWSPSRRELVDMTPNPQLGGPNYSDLARIAMQRTRTARDAVEIIGGLIDEYGYTSYGGNSHLFADADEGWVFINFAGGKGLWAAERLGPDDVRVSRPGYIGDIPVDFEASADHMGSPNLVSFAVEQGWYHPDSGEPFNVNKIYGDGQMRHPAVAMIEERLRKLAGKVGLTDMIAAVRTTELTGDSAGYGQVAHLRQGRHPELGVLWVAATTSSMAPFIPFYVGTTEVPPELRRHRYLSSGEATGFMSEDKRGIESTRFALRTYKRLLYLTEEHQEKFLPEVTEALEAFEARLIERQESVEQTALKLFEAGEPLLARKYLTYYSGTEALNGWRLGEALANSIEARTRALYGIRQ